MRTTIPEVARVARLSELPDFVDAIPSRHKNYAVVDMPNNRKFYGESALRQYVIDKAFSNIGMLHIR